MALKKQRFPSVVLNKVREACINRWLDSRGWYLVKDCFKTTDGRIAGTGEHPVRDFPVDEPYLAYLWGRMWQAKRIAVVKFRQAMLSNLIIARNLTIALLYEGSRNYILKRTFDEADEFLEYRTMELWRNIPEVIEVPLKTDFAANGKMFKIYPREILPEPMYNEGVIRIKRPRVYGDPLPTSTIHALEGVADKSRGLTGFNSCIDEAAFTKELRDTYSAMSPAMQYVQLFSSPKVGEFQHCFTIGLTAKRF